MSEAPRASIIINNYNYGRFVGEAIESALSQTYSDTEVIVVDDGSTDDSPEVIRSFGERIIPVFKANGGQGSAYNAGLRHATGDIVCFLDSDDTIDPEAMDLAATQLRDAELVKFQWPLRVVDAAGTWRGELSTRLPPPAGDLLERVIQEGPLYDFYYTTGAAYRRSFLDRIFPVPEQHYRNGADVYVLASAPVFGTLATSDQPLGTYRAHGKNNYRDRSLDDASTREFIRRFDVNAGAVERALAMRGIKADASRWKERSFNYLWPSRLLLAKQDIEALVPPGRSFILVDNNEWGAGQPVKERVSIPFIERDGEYWGVPTDDDEALVELERLRAAGASHIVFWWTSFWWFDHYAKLYRWLRSDCSCVLANDRLVAFDISIAHSA